MEEQVLEVVPVQWKKGLFKKEPWAIIITPGRLVFAKWTQDLFRKEVKRKKEESKEAGGGNLKQFFVGMGTAFAYYDKYFKMATDEVLKEHLENFSIEKGHVQSLNFKGGGGRGVTVGKYVKFSVGSSDEDNTSVPYSLIIQTNGNKMVFEFNKDFGKVKKAFDAFMTSQS